MDFEKEKNNFLSKKDKSRKGSIDTKIKRLVDRINSFEDYFTTSSCAGRILILTQPKSNKKGDVDYLFCSHKKAGFNEIKEIIKNLPKDDIWFRFESAILHVACKNIESALKLLNLARNIGFRRSGIISIGKNKAIIELVSTEKIDAIIGIRGKLVADEKYLKILLSEGNKKLEKSWEKIEKLNFSNI